jgi:hypothetical protein
MSEEAKAALIRVSVSIDVASPLMVKTLSRRSIPIGAP